MRPLEFLTGPESAGRTVKSVLEGEFEMSSSHISRLKRREGGMLLNGAPCRVNERLNEGDRLTALISDAPGAVTLEPMEAPLDIVYEDEWLIIVNKSAGVCVHPERSGAGGSLENALTHYLAPGEYVHTVSRLDRGTSGLLTVAKSGYVHERMKRIQHTPDFYKEYLGVTVGVPQPEKGFIALPLAHPAGENFRMEVKEGGLACRTEYEVVSVHGGRARVKLVPHTGRMHQLRAHMAAIGCPLVGDWLYGEEVPYISHAA
ncbi:MAG: RluA family pseudouridine synthase, partial [Clostridia bacterium]|nr:RluA family pseudouridine synthase [Clostridia bacterium]